MKNQTCEIKIWFAPFLLKIAEDITMGNDRLNGLALMLIHRDEELNSDAVVEEFSRGYPPRLLSINHFSE